MAEGSMADKLLNRLVERAQLWAEVKDDESVDDGKVIMRRRKSFLSARREAFEYAKALERTVKEVERENTKLLTQVQELGLEIADHVQNLSRLSQEIERRNRTGEAGEDEIGAKYILRLGIPELTEVFNRTVLGKR